MRSLSSRCGAILLWLSLASLVFAHDPGLSTATVELRPNVMEVALVLSVKDAALLTDGKPNAKQLDAIASQALEVTSDREVIRAEHVRCRFDESGNALIDFQFRPGAGTNIGIRSTWLAQLPPGHRQFLSVHQGNGEVLFEKLLSVTSDYATFALTPAVANESNATAGKSFVDFLLLGVKHIVTGYDHLLFLFSLLIVSRSFGSTAKIITCFTVAHSITLAFAVLGAIDIPSRIVEPIIAASIIYVSVENLVRRDIARC